MNKVFIAQILLFLNFYCTGYSQNKFAIISDMQQPIPIERLWNHQWDRKEKNEEGRDSLLNNLLYEHVSTIFSLGDLVGIGSNKKQWRVIDRFLDKLNERAIKMYAIPGNHEYLIFPKAGINNFYKRFPDARNSVQVHTIDSVSIVLLNTNFKHLKKSEIRQEMELYEYTLDSLQQNQSVKKIIVCSHQAPFTNSRKVKPDKDLQKLLIPHYLSTEKAVLFISGHSHNLEYFSEQGKNFLVIGGGGGIFQGVKEKENQIYLNLILDDISIRYFYILISRDMDKLSITIKGINPDNFSNIREKEFFF